MRRSLIVCVFTMVLLIAVCIFLRVSSPQDVGAYIGMAAECHPVWRQFALRRVGPGDSAQTFLERYPPTCREEFGRYGIYTYLSHPPSPHSIPFTNITVHTRDGRIFYVVAGSCTWTFAFFGEPDADFERQYRSYLRQLHKEANERRREAGLKVDEEEESTDESATSDALD